jgi:hypothetical protein
LTDVATLKFGDKGEAVFDWTNGTAAGVLSTDSALISRKFNENATPLYTPDFGRLDQAFHVWTYVASLSFKVARSLRVELTVDNPPPVDYESKPNRVY